MEVIIQPGPEDVARVAFELVSEALQRKPDLVLGLATGRTPLALYSRLRGAKLDFSRVHLFNLDEFVGYGPDREGSFHRYLHTHLVDGLGADPRNVHFLNGDEPALEQACETYEGQLAAAGGIDLQILGIGRNGHIGFNEPGSSLGSRTRIKTLQEQTIQDCAADFPSPSDVPRFSLTMGIGTILEAREILVLANGEAKAGAVRSILEGPITAEVPGSALQYHPRARFIVDEAAASKLARRDHWKWVYENKWRVGQ